MARIAIVGDGPAGLSAALFLSKNGHEATVYGQDKTPMHYAHLRNYLGIADEAGPDFQQRARAQVASHGASLHDAEVVEVGHAGPGLTVTLDDGDRATADYVILAAGKRASSLARRTGAQVDGGRVAVDGEYRTTVDRLYAVGRAARPERSQAIVSAGAGAVAALDILARETGQDVTDWDRI